MHHHNTEKQERSDKQIDLDGWWPFLVSITAYLIFFTYRLEDFPIYFFCDEVFPTLTGIELFKNGLKDSSGTYLPLYFNAAAGRWTPVLTVYIYGLASLIAGNSIIISRTVGVLLSLIAPIGCALTLRYIFRAKYWWSAVLLFTLAPGWIMHARTAFEAVAMSSFFSLFVLFYLLSRKRSLWYLPAAGIFAAAAFYTYSNGQIVVVSTVLLTALTSIVYYLKKWRVTLLSIIIGSILCIPLLNFRIKHGEKLEEHLKTVNSYLVKDIPRSEKFKLFSDRYLDGLTPLYWFTPNERDLERHRLESFPHISLILLPLVVIGLLISIRYIYKIEYRLPIIALLSAPVGGALVEVTILRAIVIMVPIMILSGIGLNFIFSFIRNRALNRVSTFSIISGCITYLSIVLYYALFTLPPNYRDYGLYGVQYGVKQLFIDKIPYYLEQNVRIKLRLSPVWANGTDLFPRFFYNEKDRKRVILDSVERYLTRKSDISPDDIFIFTPGDLRKAAESKKFSQIDVLEILNYPSGAPGFYFLKLGYSPDVDKIFEEEKQRRQKLLSNQVNTDFFKGEIKFSAIDNGEIKNIVDGDKVSLIRGFEANPFIIELIFNEPQIIKRIGAITNPSRLRFLAVSYSDNGDELARIDSTIKRNDSKPIRELVFDGQNKPTKKLRIELTDLDISQYANIHLWELYINDLPLTDQTQKDPSQ